MTIAQIAGWVILALIFGGLFAAMVAGMAQTDGFKKAFARVSAIWGACLLLVALVHLSVSLIKS